MLFGFIPKDAHLFVFKELDWLIMILKFYKILVLFFSDQTQIFDNYNYMEDTNSYLYKVKVRTISFLPY